MGFWWIIGRAVLVSIVTMIWMTLFLGVLDFTEKETLPKSDDIIAFILVGIGLYIMGLSLFTFEKAYATKYEFVDAKPFFKLEIFLILLTGIALSILINQAVNGHINIDQSNRPTLLLFSIGFMVLILTLKKRKPVIHLSEDEKRVLFEEKVKKLNLKIAEINHRYDTKTGSIHFQTEYKNKRLFLKNSSWRGVDIKINASLKFELSKPISSMSSKEREPCRILELLEADGLNRWTSDNLRAPMVWANGKATIGKYEAWRLEKVETGPNSTPFNSTPLVSSITEAIEWFMKNIARYPNFDSAVAKVLDVVNERFEAEPNNPINLEIKRRIEGGNAWLDTDGFDGSTFVSNQPDQGGIFLGNMPDGQECWFTGQGAIMTIAPPGSGKTQTHIIPNLLKWKGSAVVLDVKGELWDKTAGYRAKHVGKVYRFAPLDPDHSHHFNPLLLVRNDEDYLWEDAKFLADLIVVKGESKDPFWENKARELITAAIAVECIDLEPEKRDMSKVVSYCYGVDWNGLKNTMVDAPIKAMQNAVTSLINIEVGSIKTFEGIRQQAQSYLSIWEGAKVERSMKESDWHPNDLREGNITLYIALKAGEIATYGSLLRVFIAQHLRTLIQDLPSEDSPDILFMLDEFPRVKYMSELEEALEIGRQYKIKLFLAVQSIGQVQQHYKNADGLIGSCAIRAFMNPSNQDKTAIKISDELGFIENIVDGTRRKIAEPTDLSGPEYANNVIVLTSGSKPIKAIKSFAYQDAHLSERMDIPPPQIKRSAVGRLIET